MAYERTERARTKEAERRQREAERYAKADAKERQRLYIEARVGEADALNEAIENRVQALNRILVDGLATSAALIFSDLKDDTPFPALNPPGFLTTPTPLPRLSDFLPSPPRGLSKLFRKAQYQREVEAAGDAYDAASTTRGETERKRLDELERSVTEYERNAAEYSETIVLQHRQVDELETAYKAGENAAIVRCAETVLSRSDFPDEFPSNFRLAYIPDSKQLVVEYELPTFEVIPEAAIYRYVKTSDQIVHTARKIAERRQLYADVIAAISIRTLHDLFEADVQGYIDVLVFNGYVDTIDPGTGQAIRPYLLTVRATADAMAELDLRRVTPTACLLHLKAQVSRSPDTLSPVRPIVDFNMVDPRFIEYGDILSTLDQRPNLMEMSPGEFETLVTNLFAKMGLETKLTQASRDGGVDCVAYDQRPILGGKVVIQAKRYKNTVGVSAVRDLYGTMTNEHANKGILVTTSGYGKAAYDFANDKPIELLTGSNLLYLLEQQGINAKIEIPEDWQDPVQSM